MARNKDTRPCEFCGAGDSAYCKYEGRYLCKKCSSVWDTEPTDTEDKSNVQTSG